MNREEQGPQNLELAESFLQHLVEHPAELESLPNGANVVLLPDDDPELVQANLKLAAELTTRDPEQREEGAPTGVSLKPSRSQAPHERTAG